MKKVKLSANLLSKEKAQALRKLKNIPAIIYGPKHQSTRLSVNELEFVKAYKEAGRSTMIELDLAGETIPALVHTVQRNPVTERFIHVDFYALDVNKPVNVTVPLHFSGDPAGVRVHGGVLVTERDEIEVECLPKNLISHIEVDINCLEEVGSAIHVKDLVVPEGVKILEKPELNVVHIISSRLTSDETSSASANTAVTAATTEAATPAK